MSIIMLLDVECYFRLDWIIKYSYPLKRLLIQIYWFRVIRIYARMTVRAKIAKRTALPASSFNPFRMNSQLLWLGIFSCILIHFGQKN